METQFGYLPEAHDFSVGDITVSTLPGLDGKRRQVEDDDLVAKDWIYTSSHRVRGFFGEESEMPYPTRVFGLSKTHVLSHAKATDPEHMSFLVWVFAFIKGIRLTDTEAGFLDATPIKPGMLHDMDWGRRSEQQAIGIADEFWREHGARTSKGLSGVVNALFLSQKPGLLDFEELLYVYSAIDGCHAVWCSMNGRKPTFIPHGQRLESLCAELQTSTPTWIKDVVAARNDALHEALFFGEPLGFSIFGGNDQGANQRGNVILEMQCLVSRFVCAILGFPCRDYIRSPVNTRQCFGV